MVVAKVFMQYPYKFYSFLDFLRIWGGPWSKLEVDLYYSADAQFAERYSLDRSSGSNWTFHTIWFEYSALVDWAEWGKTSQVSPTLC